MSNHASAEPHKYVILKLSDYKSVELLSNRVLTKWSVCVRIFMSDELPILLGFMKNSLCETPRLGPGRFCLKYGIQFFFRTLLLLIQMSVYVHYHGDTLMPH